MSRYLRVDLAGLLQMRLFTRHASEPAGRGGPSEQG